MCGSNDVQIGAASLVLDDVPGGRTVVGVPGRVFGKRAGSGAARGEAWELALSNCSDESLGRFEALGETRGIGLFRLSIGHHTNYLLCRRLVGFQAIAV